MNTDPKKNKSLEIGPDVNELDRDDFEREDDDWFEDDDDDLDAAHIQEYEDDGDGF